MFCWKILENVLLENHLLFADDLCCFCPSIHGLQRIIDVCHSYASTHNIIFNCQKTPGLPFVSSNFKLNIKPNVVLGDFKIRFINEIKYLGVFLNSRLRDNEDIYRQVRYLYGTANRLRTCFYKCSTKIKNVLFRTYCPLCMHVSSGGYWVRRMRQSPQGPFLGGPLDFKAPPSKTAYTVLYSLQMFAQRTIRSEDLFFFRERLDFGRKMGKSEMKSK